VPDIGYSHRPVALGTHGLVASAHPLATLAGVETLKRGGTAADAVVATNAVLAVTQPYCCGLGGDLFVLYYEAASRRVHFLNGAGRSGSRATLDELRRRGMSGLPVIGPPTVTVPGCVRGWAMLLERFGSRPLAELIGPAIRCAEAFPNTRLVSRATTDFASINADPEWRRVFVPGGRAAAFGEPVVQGDLAATLRALGAEGPELFYAGRIGQAIARRLEADGFLTAADLADHRGEWGEPISSTYRGVRIYQTPPPTQGLAALLGFTLLEGFNLSRHRLHSPQHLHLLIELTKIAYADRDRWIGDPEHARVPVAALLAPEYAARRRRLYDPRKAQPYVAGDPGSDTTGFVVADAAGNVASVIQSLYNSFGSGIVVPGTGVVLNNRGRHFSMDAAHPNALAPRKRPFHTLIASILTRDDRPLAAYATMGSSGQAMFHLQGLTNLLDYGLDIQEAIERPRFVLGPIAPDHIPDTVYLEGRIPRRVIAALARKGHNVRVAADFFYRTGHAHGLVVLEHALSGGADPRCDGIALGF
jgi:gamma-glutamyltranspeptidase / glutathione hydrolase